MKSSFVFILMFFTFLPVLPQSEESEWIINPIYDSVEPFSEGLSVVQENGRFGYIDIAGNIIISPKYNVALSFRNDKAWVKEGNIEQYINRKGEIICSPFRNPDMYFKMRESEMDRSVSIDINMNSLIPVERNGKWGFKRII